MESLGGYMGRILTVDLSSQTLQETDLIKEHALKFIGGDGYAARILYNMITPETNPLGPENPIFFLAGPMLGSMFPGSTKWTICSRSPQTNIWGESTASGSWGTELKATGHDGILVIGKSRYPVYLAIREENIEIRKADNIWGMDTIEAAQAIKSDLGETKARVASIGPAGERLVRYASVVTDDGRACGRTGMGAVMGSKNLKAIAVRGNMKIPLANENRLRELSVMARQAVKAPKAPAYTLGRVKGLSTDGTAGGVEGLEKQGALPVKNWTQVSFPGAAKIGGPRITETILARPGMCQHCTVITCWRYVKSDGKVIHGPEYETLAAFGSLCMNENLDSIVKANDLCNRIGMDTISTGCAIAFAMECYEKGIITKADTGNLDLTWGNSSSIVKLAELIGLREGFGVILGEGVKRASEKIGRGSDHYAIHVRGLEFPIHEPRRWWTMALSFATSNRGACHRQGSPMYLESGNVQPEFGFSEKLRPLEIQGKAEATKFHQDFSAAFSSMGLCGFTVCGVIPFTIITEAFTAVTGIETDHWGLLKCGERTWNLKRAFNIKMGSTWKDDVLPKRILEEPLNTGPAAGKTLPFREMLDEYYSLRDWKEGKPTKSKLIELGMPEIAKDLWG